MKIYPSLFITSFISIFLSLSAFSAPLLIHTPPTTVVSGTELNLEFRLADNKEGSQSFFHYREFGKHQWEILPIEIGNDSSYHLILPAEEITINGFEYYVDTLVDSELIAQFASKEKPYLVRALTNEAELFAIRETRRLQQKVHEIHVSGESYNFGTKQTYDYYYHLNAEYRHWLRSRFDTMAFGFGHLRGVTEDDDGNESEVGIDFGYAELGYRLSSWLAMRGKLSLGATKDGFSVGSGIKLEFGEESKVIARIESQQDLGFVRGIELNIRSIPQFPLGFGIDLTNQPGDNISGERLYFRAGYESSPTLGFEVLASYQARRGNRRKSRNSMAILMQTLHNVMASIMVMVCKRCN